MVKIIYAQSDYVLSYNKAVDTVAKERLYLAATEGFPPESTIEFVKFITENNYSQYYALDSGEVIGWCDMIPKSFEGMQHVAVLGTGVLKNWRGKGIGRLLYEAAEKHAQEKNHIEKLELEVYRSNKMAISFYKRNGFVEEGVRIKSRKLDGVYDDIILMGKMIKKI